MIINEMAGSGGDLMPYMFQHRKIGPLVGKRTWGGLVGTADTPPFVDGGSMIAPRGGFFTRDDKWAVENEGTSPDIDVENWPKEVIAGHDPQLERAVAEAMQHAAGASGARARRRSRRRRRGGRGSRERCASRERCGSTTRALARSCDVAPGPTLRKTAVMTTAVFRRVPGEDPVGVRWSRAEEPKHRSTLPHTGAIRAKWVETRAGVGDD